MASAGRSASVQDILLILAPTEPVSDRKNEHAQDPPPHRCRPVPRRRLGAGRPGRPRSPARPRLEGRVAGEPVDCITLSRVRGTRIIPDTAIVYEVGNTLYVNRPRAGASSLDEMDTLVSRPFGNRLCSVDTIQLYDTSARMTHGVVFLGDFVPYRRVDRAD